MVDTAGPPPVDLASAAARATAPFGVYALGPADPGAELVRDLERAVLLETFGNTPDLVAKEYGAYEDASLFLCVMDHRRGVAAGAMRVIRPSPVGLKSVHDIEAAWGETAEHMAARTGITLDLERTWDIATLVVAEEYRGKATMGLVAIGLYQALALATPRCGVAWLLAVLDVPVFRMIRWRLRMPLAGFAGVAPRPYLGSAASLPVWCDVAATERRLARSDPGMHDLYFRGVGLEPAVQPLDVGTLEAVRAPRGRRRATRPSPAGRRRPASTAC